MKHERSQLWQPCQMPSHTHIHPERHLSCGHAPIHPKTSTSCAPHACFHLLSLSITKHLWLPVTLRRVPWALFTAIVSFCLPRTPLSRITHFTPIPSTPPLSSSQLPGHGNITYTQCWATNSTKNCQFRFPKRIKVESNFRIILDGKKNKEIIEFSLCENGYNF